MRTILTAFLLLAGALAHAQTPAPTARDGEKSYERIDDPDAARMDALRALIDSIKDKAAHSSQNIPFTEFFVNDATIQQELLTQFTENHAAALKAAQKSSGNMHNPQVLPLRALFEEALLNTPTVRLIDARLHAVGYTVSGVSHEKFMLDKSTAPVKFRAIVWLEIKPTE